MFRWLQIAFVEVDAAAVVASSPHIGLRCRKEGRQTPRSRFQSSNAGRSTNTSNSAASGTVLK